MRQLIGAVLVDGNAEGVEAGLVRFEKRRAGVLDALVTRVQKVVLIRFSVGEGDQEPGSCGLLPEQPG